MPKEMDLFLFKEGEVPMWEESPQGGIWITKLKFHENVDLMWESLMFAIIGEQFTEPNVIGISLSLRQKDKLLQVWLKDSQNQKTKAKVSNLMRHYLKLDPEFTTLYFKEHIASIKDNSTMKNALGYKFEKKSSTQDNSGSKKDNSLREREYKQHNHYEERNRGGNKYSSSGANSDHQDGPMYNKHGQSGGSRRLYN